MNSLIAIELLYAGFSTGIFLMLALYLLLSERSAFFQDSEPDLGTRKLMGWTAMAVLIPSLPPLIFPILGIDVEQFFGTDIINIVPLLIVPMIHRIVNRLLQLPSHHGRWLTLHYLIPVLLFVWHIVEPSDWIILANSGYWAIYVILGIISILKKEKVYQQHLRELYSDPEMHELTWINYLICFFLIYMSIYTCAYLASSKVLYLITDALGLFQWFFLIYHIDSHSRSIRLTDEMIDRESVSDNVPAEVVVKENKQREERDLSWIGERLEENCEKKQLYLIHDMNIDMLAAQLCTNRTYISQYLSSQGSTYYDYVNRLRIKYAKQLIDDNPTISLSTVAFQSGFRSDSTFRRAFLEIEKCTPSEYAKK